MEEQGVDGFHSDKVLSFGRSGQSNSTDEKTKVRRGREHRYQACLVTVLILSQGAGIPGPCHGSSHLAGPDLPTGLQSRFFVSGNLI